MDVRTVINTPIARVKFLTLFHFTLLVGALQGHWLSQAYLFYNILFMVTLFWAIHCRESTDAVIFAALINASSFFYDIVCIAFDFPNHGQVWSIVFSLVNLCARPFSVLLLHRELIDRGHDGITNVFGTSQHQSSYEDIDRSPTTAPPAHSNNPNNPQVSIPNIF